MVLEETADSMPGCSPGADASHAFIPGRASRVCSLQFCCDSSLIGLRWHSSILAQNDRFDKFSSKDYKDQTRSTIEEIPLTWMFVGLELSDMVHLGFSPLRMVE